VVATRGRIDISVANAGVIGLTSPLDPWDKAIADFDSTLPPTSAASSCSDERLHQ